MKRNDIKALHDKSIGELNKQLEKMLLDLAKARLEKKAGKLANVSLVARLADDIARVKTIIHEKELMERAEALLRSLKKEVGKIEKVEKKIEKKAKKKTKKKGVVSK